MMWDVFEHKQISLGEGILIALTIGIPLLGIIFRYYREKKFALGMKLAASEIPKGKSTLFVTLKARVPIAVERINVRFVEKYWGGWAIKDAPTTSIEIIELGTLSWRTPDNRPFARQIDGVGGWDGIYSAPKNWGEGEFLSIDIKVSAHKAWSGYLSFEARTTQRRVFARRLFSVMDDSYAASIN